MRQIETISLKDFLLGAVERLPEGSITILYVLEREGYLNQERMSILTSISRNIIKKSIAPLEALGLVNCEKYGMAKEYFLTQLGKEFLELLGELPKQ